MDAYSRNHALPLLFILLIISASLLTVSAVRSPDLIPRHNRNDIAVVVRRGGGSRIGGGSRGSRGSFGRGSGVVGGGIVGGTIIRDGGGSSPGPTGQYNGASSSRCPQTVFWAAMLFLAAWL